ncbi:MAG: hypothetical protein Q8M94_19660, partial [Ignavibacteria bacterium]|nr:hypothetical protein [Ignavibacteria bacterium]
TIKHGRMDGNYEKVRKICLVFSPTFFSGCLFRTWRIVVFAAFVFYLLKQGNIIATKSQKHKTGAKRFYTR